MKASQLLGAALAALLHSASSLATAPPPGTADERLPGGEASYTGPLDENAFSHPSANMGRVRELDFHVGNGFFKRLWVTAPASTQAADGLGPLYNARSCFLCHKNDGRGRPPAPGEEAVSMFLRLSVPPTTPEQLRLLAERRINVIPEPTYGEQLQNFAIAGHRAEGRMRIDYEERPVTLADGTLVALRKPGYRIENLAYGPLHPETMISPRVAPQMIGLGLLEAIPESAILALADPDDADGNGISGRPNRVWDAAQKRVVLGRFGYKAGSPSVDAQSQSAFRGDIGISTPLQPHSAGDCTAGQPACLAAPSGDSPRYDDLEAHRAVTDLTAFYAENLAVPARRNPAHPEVLAGKRIFHASGCAACHTPRHTTARVPGKTKLSAQTIWPYTDLLLHDMGEGLADQRPEGVANGREWRTAPLWGIGLTPTVSGHSLYLHDGRARNLLEAILWHGGEAEAARDAVINLSTEERGQLLRFVESL
jgi:CxxC motif-containing protein (DUF1111 family)